MAAPSLIDHDLDDQLKGVDSGDKSNVAFLVYSPVTETVGSWVTQAD